MSEKGLDFYIPALTNFLGCGLFLERDVTWDKLLSSAIDNFRRETQPDESHSLPASEGMDERWNLDEALQHQLQSTFAL